jgi:ligand-binding sensor domain-containing protein/HPt (histidine-containing phosphotransfer) domain-containing protein
VDGANGVYVATGWGLAYVDSERPHRNRTWTTAEGMPAAAVDTVFRDADGTVWFISGHRLGRLDPASGRIELLPPGERLEDDGVSILRDREGTLWVRSEKHLFFLDPTGHRLLRDADNLPESQHLGRPSLDRAGNLLVPTVAGLYRRLHGQWENIPALNAGGRNVAEVIEDHEGAYWMVGTDTLLRWPGPQEWRGWTKSEGLPDDVVWSIVRDRRSRLWVGTNNGVGMWDPAQGRWQTWREAEGLAAATVSAMAVAPDGAVIVLGYPGGLTRFEPDTLVPRKVATARTGYQLVLARDGRMWMRLDSVVKTFAASEWPPRFEDLVAPAQARPALRLLGLAPDGAIWTGAIGALASFDGAQWRVAGAADGVLPHHVSEMAPVSASEVWFHYDEPKGLMRLRFGSGRPVIDRFGVEQGLASNHISMVGRDQRGRIWAGGEHGVTRIDPDGRARRYNRHDGLIWDSMGYGAFWLEEDGSLLMGTSRGLAHFRPPEQDRALPPPRVLVTSLELGRRERAGEASPSVAYEGREMRAQFAALTFRDVKSVLCRYRLSGYESTFNETTAREASYRNLPSGSFIFEVSCRSASGVWSKAVQQPFRVLPAWWQRWWFRALMALSAAFAVWGVVWLRTRTLQADRHRLEEAVIQRSGQLAAANVELAAANSGLKARNRQMRLVLDNVEQGFVTLDRAGVIAEERSAVVERWFGACEPGTTLADYLKRLDPVLGVRLSLGWMQLLEGVLPVELSIDQLTTRFESEGRNFELAFRPILDEAEGGDPACFKQVLVVISDVTAQLAQQAAEREQREALDVFEHIIRDRAGVEQFRLEAGVLCEQICAAPSPPPGELKRLVHTLKGNAGVFGLGRLADLCDLIESETEIENVPDRKLIEELMARWTEVDAMLLALLGAAPRNAVELLREDLDELLAAVARGAGAAELRAIVESWSLEPMSQRLHRIAEQVQRLGRSLGKGEVRVVEEPHGVRLCATTWAPFWTALIHVVRNAVDHGLETPEERLTAGKEITPTVTLRTFLTARELVIEVEDDGRGVAWSKIAERARAAGLPAATEADLMAALWADGISTRDSVTEVSGRGVGAGAAREACEARGGRVELRGEAGRGTTFSFRFPIGEARRRAPGAASIRAA